MLDLRGLELERRLLRLGSKLLIFEGQFRSLLDSSHRRLGIFNNGRVEVDCAAFALFLAGLPLLRTVHIKRRLYLTA